MDNLDFYKEQYYKELERSHEISDSFGVPISIATVIVGAIDYAFLSIHSTTCGNTEFILIGSICLSTLFLGISVYHLIKCIANFKKGYNYYTMPAADELWSYEKQLQTYNAEHSGKGEATQIPTAPRLKIQNVSKKPQHVAGVAYENKKTEFHEYLTDVLVQCITQNQKNNDLKLYHRFLCIRHLTIAILACLPMVPFLIKS